MTLRDDVFETNTASTAAGKKRGAEKHCKRAEVINTPEQKQLQSFLCSLKLNQWKLVEIDNLVGITQNCLTCSTNSGAWVVVADFLPLSVFIFSFYE